jgi:RNA polymerase sigma-70 factor (ECF subfamily)
MTASAMFWKNSKFADIFNDQYTTVFNSVNARINCYEEAEDICQELFIKLYEKLETIDNPRAWLQGALRLAVLTHYTRKKPDPVAVEDVFSDENLSFVNGMRDARIIIRDVIENEDNYDNAKDIALFNLIAIGNYTYEEAGNELGMSKRQVRYRYGKTIDRLLDSLSKKGIKNIEDIL